MLAVKLCTSFQHLDKNDHLLCKSRVKILVRGILLLAIYFNTFVCAALRITEAPYAYAKLCI